MSTFTDKHRRVDHLIEEHFASRAETHNDGKPVAAVSTSDKWRWAKETGLGLDEVNRRLEALCEEHQDPDDLAATPRFRLRER